MSQSLKLAPSARPEDILTALRTALESSIEDCHAEVGGGGGHYTIVVTSPFFREKSKLESQRTVLRAIKHLMQGPSAPVHAIDSITTRAPE